MKSLTELELLKKNLLEAKSNFSTADRMLKYDYLKVFLELIENSDYLKMYFNSLEERFSFEYSAGESAIKKLSSLSRDTDEYYLALYIVLKKIYNYSEDKNIPGNSFIMNLVNVVCIANRPTTDPENNLKIFIEELFTPLYNKLIKEIDEKIKKKSALKNIINFIFLKPIKKMVYIVITALLTAIVTVPSTIFINNYYKEKKFEAEKKEYVKKINELEKEIKSLKKVREKND